MREFSSIFEFFGPYGEGSVHESDLPKVLAAMGHNPNEKELAEISATIARDDHPDINFQYFLKLFAEKLHSGNVEEELIYAFNVFDKEQTGGIPVPNFMEIMKNLKLGDKVTESEILEIIKEADLNNDGEINYKEFVKAMMSK